MPQDRIHVGIDAGHGGADQGAIGNGVVESHLTLEVAKRITCKGLALGSGVVLHLLRYRDQTMSLGDRNAAAVARGCELVVSVHANDSEHELQRGALALYWPGNETGRKVCELAGRCFPAQLWRRPRDGAFAWEANRRHWPRANAVLRAYKATAVLIEVGYLSHGDDAHHLRNDYVLDALATGIVHTLAQYRALRLRSAWDPPPPAPPNAA